MFKIIESIAIITQIILIFGLTKNKSLVQIKKYRFCFYIFVKWNGFQKIH